MDLDDLKQTFFLECDDLLAASEENLDALTQGADQAEAVNALFRHVHSIKGGARAFELEYLGSFAHAFESYMSLARKSDGPLGDQALGLLFDSVDALRLLVEAARDGLEPDRQRIEPTYQVLCAKAEIVDSPPDEAYDEFVPVAVFDDEPAGGPTSLFQITFVPGPTMLTSGVDPLMVLRSIKSLGSVTVICDTAATPALDSFDPATCPWQWSITLETTESVEALNDIVDMVSDLATIRIEDQTPVDDSANMALSFDAAASYPGELIDLGDGQQSGSNLPTMSAPPLATPLSSSSIKPAGASKNETKNLQPQSVAPKTVRVEVPKLERLGNMVGELVITQAFLMRQASRLSFEENPDLFRALEEMSQHIRDLQDSSLALRAQPLKSVFSRFGHLLRDLEKATGKKINLTTAGEDTEIDKTVVERLNEPLTHLIRNAVDHGIESPDKRLSVGKPAEGRIKLSAEQRGNQVFIELADDGGGINRERVRAKAVEKGLIDAELVLTDEEIDDLIFLPGFSTNEAVTDISGRGVGMDAVRQTIFDMGGRVYVRSEPGRGSRFLLTLPLSLAVLDAMITIVGDQRFLIPVHNVRRSIRPEPAQITRFDRQGAMVSVNGEMLRIISIASEFNVPGAITDPCRGLLILVDGAGDQQRAALLVDDLLGQEPVVVKSLERNYRKVPGIAAATILGDGRAALILDLLTLGQASGATNSTRQRAEQALAASVKIGGPSA